MNTALKYSYNADEKQLRLMQKKSIAIFEA
jgi:hypothetical protein